MQKKLKLAFNLYLILIALLTFNEKSFSLTNYEINQVCKNEKRESICKKNLQEKRNNLRKGQLIEIPVIPYKGN
tara:strand:+ start:369 stop:590 length:222 start_codon:yes stop_codon:yes gene_type:complete